MMALLWVTIVMDNSLIYSESNYNFLTRQLFAGVWVNVSQRHPLLRVGILIFVVSLYLKIMVFSWAVICLKR